MSSRKENFNSLFTQRSVSDTLYLTWIIHQPDFCCENEHVSQEFHTGMRRENVWYLKLVVGEESYSQTYTSSRPCDILLYLKDCDKSPQQVKMTVSVLEDEDEIFRRNGGEITIEKGSEQGFKNVFTSYEILERLHKIVKDGRLTIKCRIQDCNDDNGMNGIISLQAISHDIINNFKRILETGELSDTILAVGKKEFKVHKLILSSRSVVFKAMFENDMLEKQSNRIDIEDVDHEIMEKVLTYLYTDELQFHKDCAQDIFAVADKYQIIGLKSLCSKVIIENLHEGNMIESLISSDFFAAKELKEQILNYVALRFKCLPKMKDFDSLVSSHPDLLKEILIVFCNMTP